MAFILSAALICSYNVYDSSLFRENTVFSEEGDKETDPLSVKINFDKKTVRSGSNISFRLDISGDVPNDAWVSVIKSDVPHNEKESDAVNGDSAYLKDIKDGNVTLKTPMAAGDYDIRVFDGEKADIAKEIACQTFTLVYAYGLDVSIELEDEIVRPKTDLEIKLDIKGEVTDDAWITFVPSFVPHTEKDGDEYNGNWVRLKNIENGTAVIRTPDAKGPYDIRVYNGEDDEMASELDYKTIFLNYAPDLNVSIDVEKKQFEPKEEIPITVKITGDIPGDSWMSVVPSHVSHTEGEGDAVNIGCVWLKDIKDNKAVLSAPDEAGFYDIRVYNGDFSDTADEIACIPIKVGSPSGYSVNFKTESNIFNVGSDVKISSEIMGNIPAASWVGLVPSDTPDTAKDSFASTIGFIKINEIKDGSFVLSGPENPGNYELRAYNGTGSDSEKIFSAPVFFIIPKTDISDDTSGNNDDTSGNKDDSSDNGSFIFGGDVPRVYMIGDIDLDGKVSASDLVKLKKYILAVSDTKFEYIRNRYGADLDRNGKINVVDLSMMIKLLLGKQTAAVDGNIKIALYPDNIPAGSITYAKLENVDFTKLGSDAWLGLIPSGTGKTEKEADAVDICYSYLNTIREDNYIFLKIPEDTEPGNYELRIYQNDSGGELLTSENVTVTEKMTFKFNNVEWCYNEESKQNSSILFDVEGTGFSDDNFGVIAAVPVGTKHDTDSINKNAIFYVKANDCLTQMFDELLLDDYLNEKMELIALSDIWGGRVLDSYVLPDNVK